MSSIRPIPGRTTQRRVGALLYVPEVSGLIFGSVADNTVGVRCEFLAALTVKFTYRLLSCVPDIPPLSSTFNLFTQSNSFSRSVCSSETNNLQAFFFISIASLRALTTFQCFPTSVQFFNVFHTLSP
jgi:hypothetical protein